MQIFTTNPITGIIIVAVILTIAIGLRLYMIRTGRYEGKMPKMQSSL